MSKLPPDRRSMLCEKRTPDVPRCGTDAPQVLCNYHRTRYWASALVAATVSAKVTPATESARAIVDFIIKLSSRWIFFT
jgi:hypothetical protein